MKQHLVTQEKPQSGALGMYMCVILVVLFGLIGLQNITSTSSDLYLSNSKQHIEAARQLAYAGLRHYTHNFGSDQAINELLNQHQGNSNVVGECSLSTPLPETLSPQVQLANPETPINTLQSISIKGMIVPYNCDHPISDNNYRAAFEIVASVNCTNNSGVDSGCVKRSFVFNREDDDNGNLAYLPSPSPPPPYDPNYHEEPYQPAPTPSNEPPPPPPPSSKGRQEVGF